MGNCVENVYNPSIILAAQSGDLTTVKKIILMGADINYQDKIKGNTALMVASHSGDYILVGFLLENGACPLIRNNVGYTALSYAARNGHIEIGRLLLLKFYNWSKNINGMVNGKSINSHETPLMQAVVGGYRDFAILLIENGADIHSRTKYGWTALDFAKSKHYMEIVFLLSQNLNTSQ